MVEEPTLEQTIEILHGRPRALRAAPQGHDHRRGGQGRRRPLDPLHHGPPPARTRRSTSSTRPRSRVRLRHASAPPALREAQKELDRVTKEKDAAINAQEYEEAANLREAEATRARDASRRSGTSGRRQVAAEQPTVDEEEIAQVVAMWTGIPVTRIAAGRVGAAAQDGGVAPQPGHRPGRGDRDHLEGRPPRPRRPQGSQAADRLVHLPRPHRRREDGARQGARGVHVRQRGRAHQGRHERVHGAPQRVAAGRRASRLRRLRRGRPADRGRPPQELLRGPARRGREGPSGGLQHPPADPGGRASHGCQGPPGRLPQLHHHHDLEPRREAAADELDRSASAIQGETEAARADGVLRADEGEGRRRS